MYENRSVFWLIEFERISTFERKNKVLFLYLGEIYWFSIPCSVHKFHLTKWFIDHFNFFVVQRAKKKNVDFMQTKLFRFNKSIAVINLFATMHRTEQNCYDTVKSWMMPVPVQMNRSRRLRIYRLQTSPPPKIDAAQLWVVRNENVNWISCNGRKFEGFIERLSIEFRNKKIIQSKPHAKINQPEIAWAEFQVGNIHVLYLHICGPDTHKSLHSVTND